MKKVVIVLCCILMTQIVLSQRGGSLANFEPDGSKALGPMSIQPTANASPGGNIGSMFSESVKYTYENAKLDGSQYLFEKWKNHGVILVGDKKYVIPNINFNMDKQVFMSKFEDSVLVYDFRRLDKVLVNGKLFKSVYNPTEGKSKIYEIIYSSENLSVFKENYITVQEANPNPMLNRPRRKVKQKSSYFVYNQGAFSPLKLKKTDLLNKFSEAEKLKLETYAENNKLSYKKANDVDRMLAFLNQS